MPYKYIGRTTNFKGKTLWEIVGNLKRFGVGRVVVRSIFERYPEPSYLRILKVEPLACPENPTIDNVRKVRVLVEKTFRGETSPKPITIESASYKTDYRLLSREEEATYCKTVSIKEEKIFPRTVEFPPLLKDFLIREKKSKGEKIGDLQLELVYNRLKHNVAQEGETPTVSFEVNMKKLPNLSFYKNVKSL